MVTLYAAERQRASKLRSLLPPGEEIVQCEQWDQLERAGAAARCSVVCIDWLHTNPVFSRLSAFKARHPQHPVILVTYWDPENARHLKNITVEEVVWYREVERELATAVQRTCTRDFNYVRCLALPFEEAEQLPATLRKALAYACRSERPVCSVKQLAGAVGGNRSTLWHQWNKAVSPSPLRLQDFLHWILLLRALGRKSPERTWAAVAEEVGVHPHTLGRFAKQLTGRTLPDLAPGGQMELARLFRERVLESLLEERALDIL